MTVKVQSEDFDVGAELAAMTGGKTGIGGVTLFVGLVRDMAGGESVSAMTLEHYPGMTERSWRRSRRKRGRVGRWTTR